MPAIEINDLTKYYGENKVLDNISLQLEKGSVLSISGPSGAGKTTLLRCIAGLEKFSTGIIKLNNQLVQSDSIYIPPNKRNLGMAFQDLALWPHLTAYRNIDFVSKSIIKNRLKRHEWNTELLSGFKIDFKKDKFPGDLSGGEQQRVALARAFANKPKILLLDEPFSNLDKSLVRDIIREIEDFITRKEITVLIVTHNPWHFENLSCQNKILENSILK